MLELASKELKIKFNGDIISLSYPKVGDVMELNARLKNSEDEMGLLLDFLAGLGLKESTSRMLEVDHVEAIIQELTSKKK